MHGETSDLRSTSDFGFGDSRELRSETKLKGRIQVARPQVSKAV